MRHFINKGTILPWEIGLLEKIDLILECDRHIPVDCRET